MQLWMDSIQSRMSLAPVRHVKFNSDNFEYTDDDGCVIYVRDLAPPRSERVQKAVMLSNSWRRVVVVLCRCRGICGSLTLGT